MTDTKTIAALKTSLRAMCVDQEKEALRQVRAWRTVTILATVMLAFEIIRWL